MKNNAEVVIIGGGIIGCATAYYLAKEGVSVIVLEKSDHIGNGGSSRNGGGVRQSGRDPRELPLAMYAVEHMWPTLSEELGVDWDNTDFHELHSHFASITHGCLFRNALAWEEYWRWDEDDTNVAVYYNTKDKPCGFMVYLIKNDIMHIKEMIYLNREAKKGLWEYIHAHDSMIDAVHGYTYFSEPIAFEMDDGDIKETIRPYAMGRIIDIESFLQNYPCDPDGGTLYIELEIEDHLLLWNNRSFRLCFSDGKCMLTDEPAEYKLKMEIGTLTTLLLGYKTAERLYALERIEGKQEAVDRLDDVLFHKIPYISDYI